MLTIPDRPFRAYLFDCDGTIADSMPLHFIAWNKALAQYGCSLSEDLFYAWGGRPVAAIIEDLNREHGLAMPVAEVVETKENFYLDLLPGVKAIPEVLEQIRNNHGRIPFAVVSGSPRESVVRTLTALGLLELFDALVCAGEYKHGKPAPDPFLMAAEQVGVPPQDCLVFEDANLGIESAVAAGMSWVKVAQPGRPA